MQVVCVININGAGGGGGTDKKKKTQEAGDIEARHIAYTQLQKACERWVQMYHSQITSKSQFLLLQKFSLFSIKKFHLVHSFDILRGSKAMSII